MHIQEGMGNLFNDFKNRPEGQEADCTIWNPRADSEKLYRYLKDEDTAWTNGPWSEPVNHTNPVIQDLFNRRISTNNVSLTIEHEGRPADGLTEAQLNRSADMCAYWCQTWNIPPDRNHIIGHYEVGPHKGCPGSNYPFDRLVNRVQERLKMPSIPVQGYELIMIGYNIIIPQFKATLRNGPGRSYDPPIASIAPDPNRRYWCDGEAHGELIGSDDVWCHIPELKGFISRTALTIVH